MTTPDPAMEAAKELVFNAVEAAGFDRPDAGDEMTDAMIAAVADLIKQQSAALASLREELAAARSVIQRQDAAILERDSASIDLQSKCNGWKHAAKSFEEGLERARQELAAVKAELLKVEDTLPLFHRLCDVIDEVVATEHPTMAQRSRIRAVCRECFAGIAVLASTSKAKP